jgi:hypothetical protein
VRLTPFSQHSVHSTAYISDDINDVQCICVCVCWRGRGDGCASVEPLLAILDGGSVTDGRAAVG